MNATFTKHITSWLLVVCVVSVSFTAKAQSASALVVSPTEQVNRDQTRQQILDAELTSEIAAGVKAQQRASERAQAGDQVGVAEAQVALRQHNANIAALRREIEFVASPPRVSTPVVARRESGTPDASRARVFVRAPSRPAAGSEPAIPRAVAAPAVPRLWDMYEVRRAVMPDARPATTQVMEPSPPLAATSAGNQVAPIVPAWDMYRKQAVVRPVESAVSSQTEKLERIDVGLRAAPTVPFLVYRDPNAVAKMQFSRDVK